MTTNVLPVNDIKEHDESSACECQPRVEMVNGGILIIHNSYDLREVIERVYEILGDANDK